MKRFIVIIALFMFMSVSGFILFTYLFYYPYFTTKAKLLNYKDQGIVLMDKNSIPFYFVNNASVDENTGLTDISPFLVKALLAAEDRDFYDHNGVSVKAMTRSFILNLKRGTFAYGGSTITQQLVKNTLLSSKKSLLRKSQEAILAVAVDATYTKEEILEMYLNTVYFGEGAIGIKNASFTYFNKPPKDLTIAQSAYLASMLKYPNLTSPYTGDKELGLDNQKDLLSVMQEENLVSSEEVNVAKKEKIRFSRKINDDKNLAPHFALMVINGLKEKYGNDVIYEGLKVKTTLDLNLQKYAQLVVKESVIRNEANGISNGALVALDPATGDVIALVGSADWFDEESGKINMATSLRQPGSSFKPIVYALAMEERLITPSTLLSDSPKTFVLDSNCKQRKECLYKPLNFDKKFRGKVTVRRALSNSLNIPAVEVMEKVGVDKLVTSAPEFGITSLEDSAYYGKGLSLVLGSAEISPLEMATAYTAFAGNGERTDYRYILEVRDKYDNKIFESDVVKTRVITEETAFFINSILSDKNARRETFGNLLTTSYTAALKTGTTENYRDAWTIGYTPDIVMAVWVGNNDATPIKNLSGSLAAAPIWKAIVEEYKTIYATSEFNQPNSIVKASFCDESSSSSAKLEYYIDGTQPDRECVPRKIIIPEIAVAKNEEKPTTEQIDADTNQDVSDEQRPALDNPEVNKSVEENKEEKKNKDD